MNVFRYVRHADIPKYEAEGWVVVDDFADCHHGHYAVLMGKEPLSTHHGGKEGQFMKSEWPPQETAA